jgi:hypothetical protein
MMTMHEYVVKSNSSATYWRCRTCGERRDVERIVMEHDVSYHPCTIQKGKVVHEANLIDISPGGARFRLPELTNVIFLQFEDLVLFNARIAQIKELTEPRPAVIRWFKGRDYGVKFQTPANVSSEELRRLLRR